MELPMREHPSSSDQSPSPAGACQKGDGNGQEEGLVQTLPWVWEGGMISPMDERLIIFLVATLLAFLGLHFDP
jgi:hypothetical protein